MFEFLEPQVPQISALEVKTAIDAKQNIILLDVRTIGECARGMISGAINIPVNEVPVKIASTIPDKNATVYVYCLSGSRSVYAVEAMVQMGYKNVFNMTSGLLAWRSIGLNTTS